MRVLVACHKCHRQYQAPEKAIGREFHCVCGEPMKVDRPEGRDSAVVRCSSCAAPRRDQQTNCEFCGADFTLREQDLETICPRCFARLSDNAKFCDHCGHSLAAEPIPLKNSPLICPACGGDHRLSFRTMGKQPALECRVCGGFWLPGDSLEHLVEKAKQMAEAGHALHRRGPMPRVEAAGNGSEAVGGRGKHAYLPCPSCNGLMVRQNFGHRSGVVIDLCKHHGVWLEGSKLQQLLDWIKAGGSLSAEAELADGEELIQRIERRIKSANQFELVDEQDRWPFDLWHLF